MKAKTALVTLVTAVVGVSFAAKADVVTDWNSVALDAIRTDNTPPPKASRNLAILHVGIYDAVNGIGQRQQQEFEPYLVKKKGYPGASEEVAASAAAHLVLNALYPSQQPTFDTKYANELAGVEDGKDTSRAILYGEFVANAVLAVRADDGSSARVPAPTGSGPGYWVPTPPASAVYLLPQWGFVTPFAMTSSSQCRPPGPPALTTAKWAADYNEVKAIGSATSATRSVDQTQIASFWADGTSTETPVGHWNSIAQIVAATQDNTLTENSRLFALLNIAMADAAICAWDAKYTFDFWRPVTAIRNGDTDGNPATDPDPAWTPLLVTPPFPDYVSGHSTFSAAAATVLALFYGTDDISFTTGSDFLPGVQRSFSSFSAAAHEAAASRIYAGIHFRSAVEDGMDSGVSIGEWAFTHRLRPKGKRWQQ